MKEERKIVKIGARWFFVVVRTETRNSLFLKNRFGKDFVTELCIKDFVSIGKGTIYNKRMNSFLGHQKLIWDKRLWVLRTATLRSNAWSGIYYSI